MKLFARLNRKQEGFTLIELLVVMAILAVLATLVVPNVLGARERSRNSDVQAGIRKLQSGLDLYAIDHNGGYPAYDDIDSDLDGSYIAEWPQNPWTEDDMDQKYNTCSASESAAEGELVGSATDCERGDYSYIPEQTGGAGMYTAYTLYGFGVNTAGDTITVIKVGVK